MCLVTDGECLSGSKEEETEDYGEERRSRRERTEENVRRKSWKAEEKKIEE